MKKVIIVAFGLAFSTAAFSQNRATNGGGTAVNSGTVEPTINGKPYSQYKAEQDALKRQKAVPAVKQMPAGIAMDTRTPNAAVASKSAPAAQPKSETGSPSAAVDASVVSKEAAQPKQAPTLHEQALARSKDFTGNTADGKPAPAVEKTVKPGIEGGGNAPVPAATVKVQKTAAAASSPAPVAPVAMPDAAAANSNSTGGTVEKPAAQPAPKTKSEQAPETGNGGQN